MKKYIFLFWFFILWISTTYADDVIFPVYNWSWTVIWTGIIDLNNYYKKDEINTFLFSGSLFNSTTWSLVSGTSTYSGQLMEMFIYDKGHFYISKETFYTWFAYFWLFFFVLFTFLALTIKIFKLWKLLGK